MFVCPKPRSNRYNIIWVFIVLSYFQENTQFSFQFKSQDSAHLKHSSMFENTNNRCNEPPYHFIQIRSNSNESFFFIFIVVFKNELFWCCCKTINLNFLYVALKHSPSKRKSLSRVAQRSTEADSDSHRKYLPSNFFLNDKPD